MKQIFLSFLALLFFSSASSQCDAPQLINWVSVGDSAFTVTFESEIDAPYELEIRGDYGFDGWDFPFEDRTIINNATAGTNIIEVDLSNKNFDTKNRYFTAVLRLECEPGVFSDSTKFYMSAHSLTGESGFNCDSLYQPFEPLPDGLGEEFVVTFNVPDEGEFVESLSVFLDIGHTFNGDLSISLNHPNGTIVNLLDYQAQTLGHSFGLSVIFTDQAEQEIANTENGGPRGIYLPASPLSALIGEPMAGDWSLTIVDNLNADDGMVFGICLSVNGIPCTASLEGKAFYDFNENGVQNGPEPGFPFALIENTISGDQFYAGEDGDFWNCSEAGTGNLQILNAPEYYQGSSVDISLMENDQLEGILIPITPTELISDVAVDLISLEPNRPGFEANYLVQVSNVGTICQDDLIAVDLEFPEYVEIVNSANNDLTISENTATIDIDQVCPFSPFEFEITILLDDTVSLGTILEATISANVSDSDPNEANNAFTSSVGVVGSFDPNDKQVSSEVVTDEFMSENNPLRYTIRFQNTGTFYAERVVIADTIDSNLDINSLQIISTSHNMEISREDNVLYFEFDQIFLPDSTTDFEGSIGHVRYTMDPISSFSEGEAIENTAYIYFDFNEPIVTNTVETVYANPLSTIEQVDFDLKVFPNPTSGLITLNYDAAIAVNRIEIYSIDGKKVDTNLVMNQGQILLDLSALENGLYIVNFISENREGRIKVIKGAKN